MELRQLRTFASAAERESFTRAAEDLKVTQPAVSQQVAALEHELGVLLFRRRGRNLSLTESGRTMYCYARKALDLLDKASRQVGQVQQQVSGSVCLACCSAVTESFLPELIASFRQVYPHITEVVMVSDAAAATVAVEKGKVELAFTVVKPKGDRLAATEVLCHEIILVCAADHPLAKSGSVTKDQLRCQSFVTRDQTSGTRHNVDEALRGIGVEPAELTIVLESNSDDAVRGAVKQGVGVGFLPRSLVADDIDHGRVVELHVEGLHVRQTVYLVVDPSRFATAPVRAFLSFVK